MTNRRSKGFTLIELMVVITIMALLAGTTAAVLLKGLGEKKKVWARGRVQAIKLSVDLFRSANNQYPWQLPSAETGAYRPDFAEVAKNLNPSNSALALFQPLVNRTKNDFMTFGGKTPYPEINSAGLAIDSWGNEYVATWDRDRDMVIISSNGEDGIPDTADDIRSDK
jgi:general secretion pathway protein G